MASTDLTSDDMCSYNQAASPFLYIFQSGQYQNNFVFGEVGVNAAGGSAGSYMSPSVIDASSFLSGRDDVLSKCMPPVPAMEDFNKPAVPLSNQPENTSILLEKYTRQRRSENMIDTVDYNRWQPLQTDPQNLRNVVEGFVNTRGGFNTQQFVKMSWNPRVASAGIRVGTQGDGTVSDSNGVDSGRIGNVGQYGVDNMCMTMLDPARLCGKECDGITGYNTTNEIINRPQNVQYIPQGKPPGQPDYPFNDVTSQEIFQAGGNPSGPTMFYGINYDEGTSGVTMINVLASDAVSFDTLSVKFAASG